MKDQIQKMNNNAVMKLNIKNQRVQQDKAGELTILQMGVQQLFNKRVHQEVLKVENHLMYQYKTINQQSRLNHQRRVNRYTSKSYRKK